MISLPGEVGHPALRPKHYFKGCERCEEFVLGINNPLSTGYVVQASLHKGTVLWSLKNLENVGHSFLCQGQCLRRY